MSGYEGAYSSILQGVSQQLPKLRLVGQVTAQDNMISDIVTNVRRRPGLAYKFAIAMTGEDTDSIKAWNTDIAGQRVHVFIGTRTGKLRVLNDALNNVVASVDNAPYLISGKAQDIRGTTVGDEFYLLNVTQQPGLGGMSETSVPPTRSGFFYIRAGAFSKNYKVVIQNNQSAQEFNYTTPNGTGAGDAAASTPDAIAAALMASNPGGVTALNLGFVVQGAYVYLQSQSTGTVTFTAVSTPSGSTYIQTSNTSKVRTEADLPALLPPNANGMVMAVGEQRTFRYYKFNSTTMEWLESGSFGSDATMVNMPMVLTYKNTGWSFTQPTYEGRFAGDDETNPFPIFTQGRKPSGLGSFQNRLVILAGSYVYMSSSTNARRFLRSTVTALVDSDTIAVGSSANSSAEYQYAVPFQKDLLLFSQKYQALIPSSGQAITPRTATVLLTSAYSVDTLSEPVPVGRTLLFAAPRSADYFGFMEMVSSQYTDAQYVANDATAHIPKYLGGSCRFGVASSVASMVLFAPSRDPRSLIVYEYSWDGDTKVQQAWHTWRFKYPVAAAYFTNEVVNIMFIQNGFLVGCTMDPRQGVLSFDSSRRPFLDFNAEIDVVNNQCILPEWTTLFDPTFPETVKLSVSTGPLAGEAVGVAGYNGRVLTTVRSFPNGKVSFGQSYRSLLSPTPPVAQDHNGIKIESSKLTVLRFGVSTQNSSEYNVLITDNTTEDLEALDQSTLRFCSTELELGQARYSVASRAIIPARTDADTTSLALFTESTGELNFTGLDYMGRFNTRIRRR
ncbi:tail tubular protein B [Pseudomonas phage Bertil]|uniref:Tail tubular protein B n=1 Tax=Pseudomonas phage Bertil TaxID=2801385 RepID=A0A7T8EQE3_9CAUD|nr:tail tubular protein B [Pseudomonas phage Bertil]QQO90906.1 tail tubular protein [Pseudomonas phage Strit]